MASERKLLCGLIINADDLGIHPNINAGIASAYQRGILSSCTMLVTTAFLEQTVREFVRPAQLPIGIHLSLTLGKASAPCSKVPELVDEEGNLKLSASQLICSRFGKYSSLITQIRCEFESQLALARDFGLRPTHADSHQHVHMNPEIFTALEEILPRFGINRLRFCKEPFSILTLSEHPAALIRRFNLVKWGVLRWRSTQIKPQLISNDYLFGIICSGIMNKKALIAAIASAPTGAATEICIHPGFPAPAGERFYPRSGYNAFISSPARQIEHDILLDKDLIDLITRRGLALRAFDGGLKPL